MTDARAALAAMLLLLAGCGSQESARSDDPPPVSQGRSESFSALEETALATGAIADAREVSPIGLYRNRHEAGADQLCIVPGEAPGKMRFGLQVVFGKDAQCDGEGSVRRAGDRLIFNFARSACLVVAGYDGDRVAFAGALDVECANLCSGNGALDGVAFPRTTKNAAQARIARSREGKGLCPGS